MGEYIWLPPLVLFLIAAVGWLLRELHFRREWRRKATLDASQTLKEKKTLIKEMMSQIDDENQKEELQLQLDEVNTALLGLHAERLRHTLKDAGLPPEEALIADGLSQLQPQQVTKLKGEVAELGSLPPSDSIWDLLALANAYYYSGQYEDARETYDRILSLNPSDPTILHNRGVTYIKLERYDEALADFNRSLELRPDHPGTLTNRGVTYYHMERYDEALADYNRSLELRPDHPDTLMNRGVTYRYLKKYDDSRADFNRSLELKPDHPSTLYNLACLFSLWGKTKDSLDYLKKAIEIDKKYCKDAKTDKDFDNIRDDPRFKKVIESD